MTKPHIPYRPEQQCNNIGPGHEVLYLSDYAGYTEPDYWDDHIPSAYPAGLSEAITRIADLMRLPANWDGHGGHPVSRDAGVFAYSLVEAVFSTGCGAQAQIVPLAYGGVQIEWHTLKGDLEVEVERPCRFFGYFEDADTGESEEFSGCTDFARIEYFLDRLET